MHEHKFEAILEHWRKYVENLAAGESISSLQIVGLIHMINNMFANAISQYPELREISGPRMGILIRLMAEEDAGNQQGLNPTHLSHYQKVNKNTISSLLGGLEDLGLVERALDPQDKRKFFIRITPAGRQLIEATLPQRVQCSNQLTSGLSEDEKKQLIFLLEKVRHSMFEAHLKNHQPKPVETD